MISRRNAIGGVAASAAAAVAVSRILAPGVAAAAVSDMVWVLPSGDATGVSDTANISSAMTNNGNVVLATGMFYLNAGLVITQSGAVLSGSGWETVLKPVTGSSFDVISTTATLDFLQVRDLQIDGSQMAGTTANAGNLIHLRGARYSLIENVYMTNGYPNWGIVMDKDGNGNISYNNQIRGCQMDNGAAGIWGMADEAEEITECLFKFATGATAAQQNGTTSAYQLRLSGGATHVDGCVFGHDGTYTTEAILIENGLPARISNNRFDLCRYTAIHTTAGGNIITGNQFGNCSYTGSVPVLLLGSSGNAVTGNVWDLTSGTAHYTYCVAEASAQNGNLITGNVLRKGTAGYTQMNSGSTSQIVANNVQI